MGKETTKKIKVGFNIQGRNRENAAIEEALKAFSGLKATLESFDLEMTDTNFQNLLKGQIDEVLSPLKLSFEKDIENVNSLRLKRNIEAMEKETFERARQELSAAIQNIQPLQNLGGIENGEFEFKKGYEAELDERHTRYITDPKEIAIREQQVKVVDEIQKFKSLLSGHWQRNFYLSLAFSTEGVNELNYASLAHYEKQDYHSSSAVTSNPNAATVESSMRVNKSKTNTSISGWRPKN